MDNTYYKNRTVLVTGGAQGIGLGIAQAFGKVGARVFITDIDAQAGQEALTWLKEQSVDVNFILCDISKEDEVKSLMEQINEKSGQLDVLVNNAGIADPFMGKIEELSMDEFDRVLAVNLRGPLLCTKYAYPLLNKANSAAILNISSTRAFMSEPNTFAYSASKGGIEALTHSLAVSFSKERIRVNAIAPGWIEVGNWQKESDKFEVTHSLEDKQQHPAGRVGTPEDIAQAALFLCSDKAGFINGQSLVIDGGMTVKMIYV